MKVPAFLENRRQWDQHHAFHNKYRYDRLSITVFDTGECTINGSNIKPYERREYREFGIRVWGTRDEIPNGVFKRADGSPLPKSHLAAVTQNILVIDLERGGRTVSLQYNGPSDREARNALYAIPKRFHGVNLYCPGDRHRLFSGGKIGLERPDSYTLDERRQIEQVRKQARAFCALTIPDWPLDPPDRTFTAYVPDHGGVAVINEAVSPDVVLRPDAFEYLQSVHATDHSLYMLAAGRPMLSRIKREVLDEIYFLPNKEP